MKDCLCCNKRLDVSLFSVDKSRKDGFKVLCKTCCKEYQQTHRKECKIYSKKHYQTNRKEILLYSKKYAKRYPERIKARNALTNALRDRKLIKKSCEICRDKKTNGHHDSYKEENWLKVRWLCSICHKRLHIKLNNKSKL